MNTAADLLNTAIQCHQAGQYAEAEQLYLSILQTQPNQARILYLLGLAAHQQGNGDAAAQWYQRAIAVQPDNLDAHNNLGVLMQQTGQLDQATVHYRAALQLNANNPRVHGNLGAILQQLGQLEAAIAHYETALRLDPNLAAAHTNLGHALKELGHLDRAITHYETARQLMPTNPDAYRDLGDALQEQGRFQEALILYDRALAFAPNHSELQGSRIRTMLLAGNLAEGFPAYDHWRLHIAARPRPLPQPVWDGKPFGGQTLLLYAEAGSGLGDSIQFVRYAALVAESGGRVIVECQAPLVRLFQAIAAIDEVIPVGAPLPPFDQHASLLSLPAILGTNLDTIPARIPYLTAPPPTPAQQLPLPAAAKLKVGLVWGGNPRHSHDRDRSCPLQEFLAFLPHPNAIFYSLQKGSHWAELNQVEAIANGTLPIIDLSPQLEDMAATATLINQLDLVITVDTAIAHLAGALGKPVWILLPFSPDWRWFMHRTDSPWYPTARLFRQPRRHDWATLCHQVNAALSVLATPPGT